MPGTGDVWSTVGDLNRDTDALRAGHLLSNASRDLMCTPHAATTATPTRLLRSDAYGYGCFLGAVADQPARFHTGDNPGYQSLHAWSGALSIAVLCNDEALDLGTCLEPLSAALPSTSARREAGREAAGGDGSPAVDRDPDE